MKKEGKMKEIFTALHQQEKRQQNRRERTKLNIQWNERQYIFDGINIHCWAATYLDIIFLALKCKAGKKLQLSDALIVYNNTSSATKLQN